jgi:hypothetical protein|tara:strand:- start:737 stop:952 length:216 start_codon:yes stop_codon:yes gene_type:complete
MYINKVKVMSYHYPYRNGKELKQLELESKFESDRGLMIKKLLPLLEEYEDTLEGYHNEIEMTITIKPSKED